MTAEDTAHELLAVLPLLNRIMATEVRRAAGEETTMPQFRVLAHLAQGPATLSAVARARRVSLQSMSELVQALVERGWIERQPDPRDRRQHLLRLTRTGRAHYQRASDHTLRRLVPLLAALAPDELAAVQTAITALRRVLASDEADSDFAPQSPATEETGQSHGS